jgi:hypothetical protein
MTDRTLPLSVPLPIALREAVEQYDRWSNAHLLEQQTLETVKQPLYHYTNGAGLKGIFDSSQLWFTDYRHLNDPSEIYHGIAVARDAFRDAKSGADPRVGLFLDWAADLFSDENMKGDLAFFVASFSRARDDLSQWRAYADNGRGFAIGFAPRMFDIREEISASPDENAFLGSVLYDPAQVASRNRLAIDQAATIFDNTVRAQPALMRDKSIGKPFIRELCLHLIASPLIWNALTSKHPAYTHEQEVRLLIMGMSEHLAPVIKTRVRGSEIVPYIAQPWKIRDPAALAEIVVGPAADLEAEDTIRSLLAAYGVTGVEIRRSGIPYRAL